MESLRGGRNVGFSNYTHFSVIFKKHFGRVAERLQESGTSRMIFQSPMPITGRYFRKASSSCGVPAAR